MARDAAGIAETTASDNLSGMTQTSACRGRPQTLPYGKTQEWWPPPRQG
jgi:hypothetical protein